MSPTPSGPPCWQNWEARDGITVHLREDRRHIQDRDVRLLMETARTVVNLELAVASDIVELACELAPLQATLVPERREEVTTEGGLDLSTAERLSLVGTALDRLRDTGVRASLFIDPHEKAVRAAAQLGVDAVELHTGEYANALRGKPRGAAPPARGCRGARARPRAGGARRTRPHLRERPRRWQRWLMSKS